MKRSCRSIVPWIAVLAVAVAPALALDPLGPEVVTPWEGFAPDPFEGDGTLTASGAWVFSALGLSLRLTPLDDEARWRWIEERVGAHADPFGSRPGEDPQYVSFVVEIRNDSAALIVFNPAKIWMTGGGAKIERPLDLAMMRSAYRMHDREMPGAFEAAGTALLDGETMLQPGDHREGLLVFSRFDKPTTAFAVEIPLMTGSGDPIEFKAAWRERERLRKAIERDDKRKAKKARRERQP